MKIKRPAVKLYSVYDLEFYNTNGTLKEKTGDDRFITKKEFNKVCKKYEEIINRQYIHQHIYNGL